MLNISLLGAPGELPLGAGVVGTVGVSTAAGPEPLTGRNRRETHVHAAWDVERGWLQGQQKPHGRALEQSDVVGAGSLRTESGPKEGGVGPGDGLGDVTGGEGDSGWRRWRSGAAVEGEVAQLSQESPTRGSTGRQGPGH